jgi:hypothetical protein
MSTWEIESAKEAYGGSTESETLLEMARRSGCYRIYKYTHAASGKTTHTHYKQIASEADERAMRGSSMVRNAVLVYDRGKIVNLG